MKFWRSAYGRILKLVGLNGKIHGTETLATAIVDILNSKNMTYKEYRDYINATYNKDGKHVTRHFTSDGEMTNANNTSDRDADKGVSWIEYWRAMTDNQENPLHCSSCGKEIYTGDVPAVKSLRYKQAGDFSSHKAEGGHIWLQGSATEPGGRYITPLCPSCNALRGQQIPVLKDSVIFKELGANIVDKN